MYYKLNPKTQEVEEADDGPAWFQNNVGACQIAFTVIEDEDFYCVVSTVFSYLNLSTVAGELRLFETTVSREGVEIKPFLWKTIEGARAGHQCVVEFEKLRSTK